MKQMNGDKPSKLMQHTVKLDRDGKPERDPVSDTIIKSRIA